MVAGLLELAPRLPVLFQSLVQLRAFVEALVSLAHQGACACDRLELRGARAAVEAREVGREAVARLLLLNAAREGEHAERFLLLNAAAPRAATEVRVEELFDNQVAPAPAAPPQRRPSPLRVVGAVRIDELSEPLLVFEPAPAPPLLHLREPTPRLLGPRRGRVLREVLLPSIFGLRVEPHVVVHECAVEEFVGERWVECASAVEVFDGVPEVLGRLPLLLPSLLLFTALEQRRGEVVTQLRVVRVCTHGLFELPDRLVELALVEIEAAERVQRVSLAARRAQKEKTGQVERLHVNLPVNLPILSAARHRHFGVTQSRHA